MGTRKREPWERMPKESDPAWEAFVVYRDWPEEHGTKRTIDKARRALGKSQTLLEGWSMRWNWRERCSEYDAYMDEIAIEERIKAKRKRVHEEDDMDARHVSMAIQLQKLMLNFIKEAETDGASAKQLSDLTKAVEGALSIERTSRHADNVDRRLDFEKEMFEYKKEQDAGENIEYEYIDDVEADIYGDSGGDNEGEPQTTENGETQEEHPI